MVLLASLALAKKNIGNRGILLKMKKIVHLQLLPLLSGVQRVCLDELQRLDASRFDRYLICRESGPLTEEAERLGIKCLYISSLKREISIKDDVQAFFNLFRIFRKYRFDIVHTHSSKTGVLGRVAAFCARVPKIVHTVHGFSFPAAKSHIDRLIYLVMEWIGVRCGDVLICLHNTDKDIAISQLGAKNKQIIVLPNGVDIEKFRPSIEQEKQIVKNRLSIPSKSIVVGMVGRLWKQKNPAALLQSAIDIISVRQDVHFIFAGDGEMMSDIKDKISKLNYDNRIHMLGWQANTADILHGFDVFVLPSLWEGMPLAILEAQASGLPCVVSNIQGNNHLVSDGKDGLLFSLLHQHELTEKLLQLINNSELRASMGHSARLKVVEKYSIEKRIEHLISIYSN